MQVFAEQTRSAATPRKKVVKLAAIEELLASLSSLAGDERIKMITVVVLDTENQISEYSIGP